jgi:3,4-dihydroxy 2-butanone 4-phosphate synthase/GTP cyclohydrolase II
VDIVNDRPFHAIEEAIYDLIVGKVVIVVDDEQRENEGDFVALAAHATPEVVNFMITEGRGLVCVPITEARARALDLPMMVQRNTDYHGTAFTVSIDHEQTTTGISAHERAQTIRAMIDERTKPSQFRRPGHVFPLIARDGGVLRRAGHTEAAVDLARMCGSTPAAVICEVMREDGSMARVPDLWRIADRYGLKLITIQDLIRYRNEKEKLVHRAVEVHMPTDFGTFRVVGYTNDIDSKEHIAFVKGDIDGHSPVLVRVHSECLTGDVFRSWRCDCGQQLAQALRQIEHAGSGVLLYMRQEGRGIGLLNKLRAYALQEQGYDTVEANVHLGFGADLRDYGIGAQMLKDLGVRSMRLMTNNPRKIAGLSGYGLTIAERVPLQMPHKPDNEAYMLAKKIRLGHLFGDIHDEEG